MSSDVAAVAVSGVAVHLRLAWLVIRARLRRRGRGTAGDDWTAIADAVTDDKGNAL